MQEDISRIKELIKRIAKNDEKALEELFDLTKKKLYFVAKDHLEEKSYIDDVLSESYLKIYRKANMFNEKYNGYTWMYEIVKNTAIDFNRKNNKNSKIEEYDDSMYNPDEEFLIKAKREDVRQALKILDEKEYRVIYLRIWEKKTLKIIAKEMKYSITRVYSIYREAIEKLRKELE